MKRDVVVGKNFCASTRKPDHASGEGTGDELKAIKAREGDSWEELFDEGPEDVGGNRKCFIFAPQAQIEPLLLWENGNSEI